MKRNPVQFGITREDPRLERELADRFMLRNLLLVASGGCTGLSLLSERPELNITLFDFNPAQLQLVKEKINVLKEEDDFGSVLNQGLNLTGNFESLFNGWRNFLNEFVLDKHATENLFTLNWSASRIQDEILSNPYWPVSFDLYFNESILKTMFGEAAIQHAPRGTYPRYFQRAFEQGLHSKEYGSNPFLQHLFLGQFLTMEGHLKKRPLKLNLELIQGTLLDVGPLKNFDLIQLSNIFDWMDIPAILETVNLLKAQMHEGAYVLLRQINHDTALSEYFGPAFRLEESLSQELHQMDRSLFYSKITVLKKVSP